MTGTTLYSYRAIRPDQLRLLRLSRREGHTHGSLEVFSIHELPAYHTLSYTWRPGNKSLAYGFSIEIEQRQLPILDSLQPFIKTLAAKELLSESWWWIDSICIDQSNLEERAQQVQLMQHIYQQTENMVIWLGEESVNSNLAIDFIELHDEIIRSKTSREEFREKLLQERYDPSWSALTEFISRKWWSRIWTVQEFVLPKTASFWCGMRSVSRQAVCNSIAVTDRCRTGNMEQTPALRNAFNRRRAWVLYKVGQEEGRTSIRTVLALAAYFGCMDATDSRDHLYGLRALATNGDLLGVSYLLNSHEVFLRFAQEFIRQHKSLDIICFAALYSGQIDPTRPSWVPHWHRMPNVLVVPLMVSQSCNVNIGNLRSPGHFEYDSSIRYSASGDREAVVEFDKSALIARGVIIDIVDGMAATKNTNFVQCTQKPEQEHSFTPMEVLTNVCRSLVLDRKERFLRYAMPVSEFVRDFACLLRPLISEESDASVPEEIQEWFQWARELCYSGQSLESILRNIPQADIAYPGHVPNQDEYDEASFFGRFFDTVLRMSLRLMISRDQRFGMVPEKAQKGDQICVLFGCSVPVLLRKSEHGDSYTFIGECFLNECMDGSVLDKGNVLGRTFRII